MCWCLFSIVLKFEYVRFVFNISGYFYECFFVGDFFVILMWGYERGFDI